MWMALAFLILIGAGNGYLIYLELRDGESGQNRIAPAEQQVRHDMARQDPLLDLRYSSTDREANLKSFGLPDEMVEDTLRTIIRLEDRHGSRLQVAINAVAEPKEFSDALCGRTSDLRPRYGALRFIVEEDRGAREVIDLQRTTELERQEWSRADLILDVYGRLELGDDRQDDAPLMAIAAILLGKEREATENLPPWDRSTLGTWSWDVVKKENPGIEIRASEYFALMHLAGELAQAEGGFCGN
jgi:hypothetical protein